MERSKIKHFRLIGVGENTFDREFVLRENSQRTFVVGSGKEHTT